MKTTSESDSDDELVWFYAFYLWVYPFKDGKYHIRAICSTW